MGKRLQPRQDLVVPVRIFGTDASGKIFSETAATVDVSQGGAQLSGVSAELKLDEIIGLTYEQKKIHFRVKWVGQPGTPKAGHVGLLNLSPEKPLWGISFPETIPDNYVWKAGDRRKHPRIRCTLSVELQPVGGSPVWANAADLSIGGCFVEMAIPLKQGEKLKIGLWMEAGKLWVQGEVASSTPGFGVGVKFDSLSEQESAAIKKFLQIKPPQHGGQG